MTPKSEHFSYSIITAIFAQLPDSIQISSGPCAHSAITNRSAYNESSLYEVVNLPETHFALPHPVSVATLVLGVLGTLLVVSGAAFLVAERAHPLVRACSLGLTLCTIFAIQIEVNMQFVGRVVQ